ncbi:MAG: hypothetical protein Q8O84_02120 [Nanoarchaeota archaeon]|nr:hypothetical protein [Nanoarchaeota archaeon]
MFELIVERGVTKTWKDFISQSPKFSIALDGYVSGPTNHQIDGRRLNLNHHEGVNRLITKSTSAQTYFFIKQGMIKNFYNSENQKISVYVNDPDQDVCLSLWLLFNYKRIMKNDEPLIERLVEIEDKLDITCGTYPFDSNSKIMKEMAWIFEPYIKSRHTNQLYTMTNDEIKILIKKVLIRIDKYSQGKCEMVNLDTRYKLIQSDKDIHMIEEIGPYAKMEFIKNGINKAILVKKRNENYTYTLLKTDPFVLFPLEKIYAELNKIEKKQTGNFQSLSKNVKRKKNEKWGGSDLIGGSPRISGSAIKPDKLISLVSKITKNYLN